MRFIFSFPLWLCSLCGLLLLASSEVRSDEAIPVKPETPPRIALWNPQMTSNPDMEGNDEINIDQDRISRIQNWLLSEKVNVSLLRASEISDATVFNAEKFDAVFLPGDALVRWMVSPLREFAQKGGILVAINARNQPWSVPLVPDVNGKWRKQPKAKRMDELANLFGSKWGELSDENGAGAHYFSTTLQTNLPPVKVEETAEVVEAPDYSKPVLRDFLPAPKVTVEAGTILKSLIISRQSETDQREKTPQAFMMQKDNAKAIIVCNTVWSSDLEDGGFLKAPQLWNAVAKICRDWKAGTLEIK